MLYCGRKVYNLTTGLCILLFAKSSSQILIRPLNLLQNVCITFLSCLYPDILVVQYLALLIDYVSRVPGAAHKRAIELVGDRVEP